MNRHSDDTISYYDDRAEAYARATVDIEMAPLYAPFLSMIPRGGKILDAGCGSGRDTKAFLALGYDVAAFDASESMARLATRLTGAPVAVMRFQELAYDQVFDGIWASASLLHVPITELAEVTDRLVRALRSGGVLYASFKQGDGERVDAGRLFTDMNEARLERFLSGRHSLGIIRMWSTSDVRPEHANQVWMNVLMQKRT